MTWYSPLWEPKSRATLCASEVSSNCWIFTVMPVRFLKGVRLAAIAEVGAVFSEIKLMVIPLNRFHSLPSAEAPDDPDPPPHPANHGSEAPARPAPVILRKSLLVIPFEGLIALSRLSCPYTQFLSMPNFPQYCSHSPSLCPLPTARSPSNYPSKPVHFVQNFSTP